MGSHVIGLVLPSMMMRKSREIGTPGGTLAMGSILGRVGPAEYISDIVRSSGHYMHLPHRRLDSMHWTKTPSRLQKSEVRYHLAARGITGTVIVTVQYRQRRVRTLSFPFSFD